MIIIKNIEELEAERERQRKAWREAGNDVEIFIFNLTGADLSGANLSGADLKGAKLMGANLTLANLTEANLRGADLEGANLEAADFCGADLSSLYILKDGISKVKNTNLKNCYFLFANFKNATLFNCDFRGGIGGRLSSSYLIDCFTTGAVITPIQVTDLTITYGSKFMAGFIVKELEA